MSRMLSLALVAAATGGGGAAVAAESAKRCMPVSGTIEPNCNGSSCIQGRVTGDLSGSFNSRTTSIYPEGDRWRFTGWTRVILDGKRGIVETLDAGTMPKDARGGPDLTSPWEVLKVSDVSGELEEYEGTIGVDPGRAVGKTVRYSGNLCRRGEG